MSQSLSYLIQRLKPYWLDAAVAVVGIELNKIIHFPANADPAEFYDKDEAGLIAALAATSAGSSVWLPPFTLTLTGAITLPDDIEIFGRDKTYTIVNAYGFIMGENTRIANMTISIDRSSAGEIIGVENSVTGESYIETCDIKVTNSGAGGSVAVACDNAIIADNGIMYLKDCYLQGYATGGGSGYCGRSMAGKMFIYHSRGADFTTDRFIAL